MSYTTCQEHYQWCCNRAEEYLEKGDIRNGAMSFLSDMSKHPETEKMMPKGSPIAMMLLFAQNIAEVRKLIHGFPGGDPKKYANNI